MVHLPRCVFCHQSLFQTANIMKVQTYLRQFLVMLVTCLVCCHAWPVLAEEQSRPHFYQPGSAYEKEPVYTFTAVVRKLPEKGTVGIWVVDDRYIAVTSMTKIQGNVVVGANVEVKGVLQGTDFLALAVTVKDSKS
jgi:hypothetical protein